MRKVPKILVADDMQMIRRTLKSVLIEAGMTGIVEAKNGAEVVEHLKQEQFDLIICDWEMPEMSGIEALRYARQDERHKETPFVMVTSVAEPEKIRQAMTEGVTDYIVKPVKPNLFLGKIRFVLRKFYDQHKTTNDKSCIKKWVIT